MQVLQQLIDVYHRIAAYRRIAKANAKSDAAYSRGNYAEADEQFRLSIEILEETFGPEHPAVAERRHYLDVLIRKRREVEVISAKQEKLLSLEKELGAEHPDVAKALNDVGFFHFAHGDNTEAMRCYELALGIQERILGPDNPEVAETLNNLGLLHRCQDNYEDAKAFYNRALAIREKTLPPDHPLLASTLSNLAILYADQGDYVRAEPLFRKLLETHKNSLGSENSVLEGALESYAEMLRETGHTAESEELDDYVHTIQSGRPKEPKYDVFAEEVWKLHMEAAERAYRSGDLAEAALELEAAAEVAETFGPEDPRLGENLACLAVVYHDQGHSAEAKQLSKRALTITETAKGPDHPNLASILENYAALLHETGSREEAEKMEARVKAIRTKHAHQNPVE